jgi:hypothetical protein
MKGLLETDFLPVVKQDARKTIVADRAEFQPILSMIRKYCAEHKLILSDKMKLSGEEDPMVFQPINIYTVDPLRHANNLTNEIYLSQIEKTQDAMFTRLKTMREKTEFAIEYYFRNVAFVHRLQKFGKGEPMRLVNPVKLGDLLFMPAELELIDLYHELGDVSKTEDYEDNSKIEKILFEQVVKRKKDGVIGAGACVKKNREIDVAKLLVVNKFLKENEKFVLVGTWATNLVSKGGFCGSREKVQILGELSIGMFEAKLRNFVEKNTRYSMSKREQRLHIPKDFRTVRHTFYLRIGGSEKPFLDYFNAMEFEIVPSVIERGVRLGTQEVLLRFLFIDLWILGVIREVSSGFEVREKIERLWIDVQRARMFEYDREKIEFLGVHRDYMVDKKLSGLGGKMFYPYYPHVQKERAGEVRVIKARN